MNRNVLRLLALTKPVESRVEIIRGLRGRCGFTLMGLEA